MWYIYSCLTKESDSPNPLQLYELRLWSHHRCSHSIPTPITETVGGLIIESLSPVLAKKIMTPWNVLKGNGYTFSVILTPTDFGAHNVAVQSKIWTNKDLNKKSGSLEVHSFPFKFSPWGQGTKWGAVSTATCGNRLSPWLQWNKKKM